MPNDTLKTLDRISSALFSGFPEPLLSSTPVNVYREDGRYVVEAELPGFDPSSIDVTAEAGMLTIRADRDASREDRDDRWLVRERTSAHVVRQIPLGDDVDLDAIAADFRDGVLKVTLPVGAEALPRKVAVAVGAPSTGAQQAIGSGAAEQEGEDPKARPAHSDAS